MLAMDADVGRLWNIRNNDLYEVRIKDKKQLLDHIIQIITKGTITEFIDARERIEPSVSKDELDSLCVKESEWFDIYDESLNLDKEKLAVVGAPSIIRIATIFSSRKPSMAAIGKKIAGMIKSFVKEQISVGFIFASAFLPSNPAPRPIKASGVANTEKLCKVLFKINGISILVMEITRPRKMPIIIGFVAMPFNDFLRLFLSSPVLPGAVKDKIITAATLYKGTVAKIINGAIELDP